MLSKRILILPIGCLFILSVVCVIAFGTLANLKVKVALTNNLERSLQRITTLVERDAPATAEAIQEYLHNISLVNQNERLTIVDRQGKVLGDSALPKAVVRSLSNHRMRPEIQKALNGELGYSTRFSETLNSNLLYVAKPLRYPGFEGVIRLAMPMAYAENFIVQMQWALMMLLFTVIVIMAGLALFLYHYVQKQLVAREHSLEHDVEERTKEVELLQRLATMLAACNSVSEAQQVVEDVIPRILGDINGAVSLIRSSRNQLSIKLDWGGKWQGAQTYGPDECWALRKGKFHLSHDNYASLPCSHMDAIRDHHTLCIPLIAHSNTIGIMHFDTGTERFDQDQMQIAFTVAEHLGLALANLNLQEKLREQAIRDPLTGLHNRRYLEETMPQEMMRAKRNQAPLTVMMLDVDHFKLFNDNFGHDAGDYVLKLLASLLVDGLRAEDYVCRIGGEEIAVLMPSTDGLSAGVVANRLCHEVEKMDLSFRGQSLGKLTLSIGIACNVDSASPEDMLKQADLALYEAKENGRNQYRYANASYVKQEQAKRAEGSVIERESDSQGRVIRARDKVNRPFSNDTVTQVDSVESGVDDEQNGSDD